MAMEVEYEDVEQIDSNQEGETAEAADIVNGAGPTGPSLFVGSDDDELPEKWTEPAEEAEQETPASDDDSPSLVDEPETAETAEEIKLARIAAEKLHAENVEQAKAEHTSAALRRQQIEIEFKESKAEEKAALKNLTNLLRNGPAYPVKQSQIEKAVQSAGEPSAIVVDDPSADTTWRLIPTSEIIMGIKGMGQKKVDAITALAPTLGDLEELRGAAGKAMKPFGSVLPRGIGGAMADEIEERILTKMQSHMQAIERASEAVEEAEVEDVEVESEPVSLDSV